MTTFRSTLLLAILFLAANAFAVTTPVILSLSPSDAIAGTSSFTMTVNGANFVAGAQVRVNGSGRATSFVSSSQLTATIFFGDIANAATLQITVASGGVVSSPVNFVVYPNDPQIASFDPATTPAQSANLTITLNGSNFGSTAAVRVNGANRQTTYVSPTQLTFTLLSSDVATARTLPITVLNPNNKVSQSVNYTITAPSTSPTITLLSPDHVAANSGAFTLGVVGTNFVNGSIVKANTASRTTTFVDSQHLNVQMLASDVQTAGSVSILVNNPNGQTSPPATLTVTSATLPTITSLSPSSTTVGAQSFVLPITGTNFTANATVTVGNNSTPRSVQFVDAQHVKVTIFPSDINTAGSVPITLTVPGTTGGTSNSFNLYVTQPNAPVIASLDPSTLPVNSTALKVLINGS
ncbi:MAG TPA: cell shape-determining protein, partial [Thermoanaerobaculia bacterium]|nr:cell shape-determining protein [Thermoanaerobaculia bacterium]